MSYPQKSIKNWAVDDRPREKFISKGYRSLSDSELLAILLRSGDKNNSALDLAKAVLTSVQNNWHELSRLTVNDLCKFKGIGPVKAVTVITALEIGRRRSLQEADKKPHLRSSRDIFEMMQPLIGGLNIEEFWVLYLNQKNLVLKKQLISRGGIAGTSVDVRLILKSALEVMATSMILVHNHPSGGLIPSQADKNLTANIKKSADILNILVLDHLIVTQNSYFSFADEGIL